MDKAIQKLVNQIFDETNGDVKTADHYIKSEKERWTKIIKKFLEEVKNE